MRLVTRFILVMSAVVILLVAAFSFYLIRKEKGELTREARRQAIVLVETLSLSLDSATFLERRDLLMDYFDRLIPASEGQILYVLITSLNGVAWLDTSKEREYQILQDPLSQEIGQRLNKERKVVNQFLHPTLKEEVLEVAVPIIGHEMDRGILRIGFSLQPLRARIRWAVRNSIIVGIVSLVAGILLSVFFARGVAHPIGRLVAYAQAVASGELGRKVNTGQGIREMNELAESLEKMKRDLKYIYIGGLFRDFSHAIKGDLGFLYSEIERLKGDEDAVRPLRERLDRITDTIEKFKDFQKPSDFSPGPIEIGAWIARFVAQLPLNERDSLDIDLSTNLPPVTGDAVYLERALGHLLKNAREADHHGPIGTSPIGTSPVRLGAHEKGGQLVLEVSDKGFGIRKEDLSRVFDAGFTTKRAQGGNGLGLALTKMIVEDLHGGEVQIESHEGSGTTVRLIFPVA